MSSSDYSSDRYAHFSVCGAILAGGRSTRMGTPKAFVELPSGETMLDRVLNLLLEMRLPRVVVGRPAGNEFTQASLPVIVDPVDGRGPVGGLFGLLSSGLASHYLVLACDQPLLSATLLSPLLEVLDDRPTAFADGDFAFPLPGLYPASLLPRIESQLSSEQASLNFLLQSANARLLRLPTGAWHNLRGANTPKEFAELSAELMNRPPYSTKEL